jgi:hypothetical protein
VNVTSLRTRLFLRHLAASSAPILCGPWRSEVGFHALYFQPWLNAWRQRYQIDPDRIIVVAPGGSSAWHAPCRQVELFDHVSMAQVRQGMLADSAQKGTMKQTTITAQDSSLLALVAANLGLRRYHVLHPSLMYQELAPWFGGTMTLGSAVGRLTAKDAKGRSRMGPLAVPPVPFGLNLPPQYWAVKFYMRPTFPAREDLRDWVEQLVERLTQSLPVVLLQTGLDADDHQDFPIPLSDKVISLAGSVTPQNNLAVQSAVLAKAHGFVGTYGGTQQLALRLGKPSVGFYTEFAGTCYAHKQLSEYLATQAGTPIWIGTPQQCDVMKLTLGG